ncbi:type II secretion system protein [Campylobacter sp. MOP7]|uniref:type II secretion system protein n=1 Tax=Campylobacter canis TaxID=3378588 RepID=UPI00387ED264
MIELIFVIVILGILAAVAIPRLSATRDDAEIAKIATNLSTLISDIGGYYTSQGNFGTLSQMSNVYIEGASTAVPTDTAAATGTLTAAGKKCLAFSLKAEKSDPVAADAKRIPAHFVLTAGTDAAEAICKKVINDPEVQKIITATFIPKKYDDSKKEWVNDAATTGLQITGLSVVR